MGVEREGGRVGPSFVWLQVWPPDKTFVSFPAASLNLLRVVWHRHIVMSCPHLFASVQDSIGKHNNTNYLNSTHKVLDCVPDCGRPAGVPHLPVDAMSTRPLSVLRARQLSGRRFHCLLLTAKWVYCGRGVHSDFFWSSTSSPRLGAVV